MPTSPPPSPSTFLARVGARRPWVVGGMAYGIASVPLVTRAAEAGCLAFYGAAGVPMPEVERALACLDPALSVGVNVAHHPHPTRDGALLRCVARHGLRFVEASGFLRPTPELLGYRFGGLADGEAPRFLMVKLSRTEAAARWLAPPPLRTVRRAVDEGWLTAAEAEGCRGSALADALVLEGDSGGHTDRRSWLTLLPVVRAMGGNTPTWLGVAGGLGTPEAVAAALAAGADFALGGSVHQSCREAGVRGDVRRWLEDAGPEDFAYAPSPVRFGTSARVQVLGRPTPFARHAQRVEAIWKAGMPSPDDQGFLEARLGSSLEAAWARTAAWLEAHDPALLAAARGPRDELALMCRGWLARCARRAVDDDGSDDVQVWCGPALAALNARTSGTPLARDRDIAELCTFLAPQEIP